jgi:integrase
MRPAEACAMRGCDIDTSGPLWKYRPASHKTQHHGYERDIYLGPKARALVEPFIKANVLAHLFSPADAEAERLGTLHARRKTPLSCGNVPGNNRVRRPARAPRDKYTVTSYRRAIARACQVAMEMPAQLHEPLAAKAVVADTLEARNGRRAARAAWNAAHVWHPHQWRHNAATRLRREYGLEAAQVILGHKTLKVTEIYAAKNVEAAKRIMSEVG